MKTEQKILVMISNKNPSQIIKHNNSNKPKPLEKEKKLVCIPEKLAINKRKLNHNIKTQTFTMGI